MERNGDTAYKMSADLEISDSLIGYWKRGQKMPGAKNLSKLASYFGVTTDYLLGSPTLRSNIIERLRRKLNLSATQLSAMTDIPIKRLQSIELDFVAPTNDEVMKLAETLVVSSRSLLCRFPAIGQETENEEENRMADLNSLYDLAEQPGLDIDWLPFAKAFSLSAPLPDGACCIAMIHGGRIPC